MASFVTAIFILSVMIFIHELGHFLMARKAGVGVEKFSMGLGPKIWGMRRGETEYLVSAIPFGGYVKMVGEHTDEEGKEEPVREDSFLAKSVRARMSIVFAGPASNMLSAVVIIYFVSLFGVPALLPTIGEVSEDYPAAAAGLLAGDMITAVEDEEVKTWDDLTGIVHGRAGVKLTFAVVRDGEPLTFDITPRASESKNIFGETLTIGLVGITPMETFTTVRYGPVEALEVSLKWTYGMTKLTLVGIVKMFQGVVPADNLGGPIMIVQAAGKSAEQGMLNLLYFTAYISVALGLFNLFPIPVLDGGLLLFLIIEGLRGKPLSLRTQGTLQQVGLVLLVSLMIFATKNDIWRQFGW